MGSIQAGRRLSEALFTPDGLQRGQSRLALKGTEQMAAGNNTFTTNSSSCSSSSSSSSGGDSGGGGGDSSGTTDTGRTAWGSPAQASRPGTWGHMDTASPHTGPDDSSRKQTRPAADLHEVDRHRTRDRERVSDKDGDISKEQSPSYMKQFFGASRLHFIGTWRSRLPVLMEELLAQEEEEEEKKKHMQESSEGASDSRGAGEDTKAPQYDVERFVLATGDGDGDTGTRNSGNVSSGRAFIHVDMDCFFVAVLIRGRPHLWSRPAAVAHSSSAGSSEVGG